MVKSPWIEPSEARESSKICFLTALFSMALYTCKFLVISLLPGFLMDFRITHIFSALCIHTVHLCRTTGTAKNLAEHRAKLCLLGLQELQKSWDLKNWVLDLFFRCIDENTARNLRLSDTNVNSPTSLTPGRQIRDFATETSPQGLAPSATPNMLGRQDASPGAVRSPASLLQTSPQEPGLPMMDPSTDVEWPGLFNFSDDFTDVLGVPPTNLDTINPQNLAFLYRFL